ncbi:family 16 glycoside hydrolase [Cryphonectria parasitica EP155]|uniref:endo-1,3(4)-beta-glucanase n=1 Tax=Cryphonectria parasitica (strain ATCC 38755 / EP155) TaxID=660469 RepID=A0A9P5CT50_CRYP1|nr:family 16 glycoside hydrolase [Cryphonectria parasitica EP155]KAF3769041.1 family 16 glycoside hydrolase [Cryphonectria parasitica EP155]
MLCKLATLLAAGQLAAATTYTLQDSYTTNNFFDEFDFYTGADPTNGFVDYQSASAASASGLAGYSEGGIYLGADYKTSNPTSGRASTRVSSKKSYTHMLLVADVNHMPVGCGTWPALWSFGPDWPAGGEIDIIEGVNSQTSNEITLHTEEGCTMSQGSQLTSTKVLDTFDCGADNGNTGCPQLTTETTNFGTGLNAGGGGVYAMEWTSSAISVWFFPRNSSNANALTGGGNSSSSAVDTSGFGTPQAQFSGGSGCDIDQYFTNHTIIIDTTFCGDWAGKQTVWSADDTCSALASTCEDYVANNPDAFVDAYWLFNSINVYQASGSSTTTTRRAQTDSTIKRRLEKYRL